MSDCCGSSDSTLNKENSLPRKFSCPVNEKLYVEVEKKTILQHINSPWKHKLSDKKYYFCNDPNCDVVYFGFNGELIYKSELRTSVGVKESNENALICYCFGVSKALSIQNSDIKAYVTKQTKEHNCACDIRNPSGRCCLKDFSE